MSNDRTQLQALGDDYWEKAYAREFAWVSVDKAQLLNDLAAYQKICNEQLGEIRRLRKLVKIQSEDNDPEAWKLECGT